MGLFQRISDAISGNRRTIRAYQETNNRIFVNPLCSAYENLFAQVQPYINDMKMVVPYGKGRNGARLDSSRTPELTALMAPNDDMGWDEFISLAISTWLTEKEVNIHVWKNQRGRVYGYSILPVGCRSVNPGTGENEYKFIDATNRQIVLTDNEVFTMRYSRSPRAMDEGVSPATAIFTYTQLDDLIAQYQRAYFENGAVPAQIAFIRASSQERYMEVRKDLENGLHGARNKNKTLFVWRQFNGDDDSEKDQVEYKTIQSNNSTLALKEIMSIVIDKSNKAFGVSNFILGDDSSAKYDNAELSRQQFLEHRVLPALRSFWNQFQHGLDRVTGGLGYAIDFDLEIPEITERQKARAEIGKIHYESLVGLIDSGATPVAAINALNLSEEWLPAAKGIYNRVLSASAPNQSSLADKHSKKDKNTLKKVQSCSSAPVEPTKDAESTVYIPNFGQAETMEKAIYDQLMGIAQAIAESNDIPLEDVIAALVTILTDSANDGANAGGKRLSEITTGQVEDEIKSTLENDGFHVSEEFTKKLEDRTKNLVDRFAADTRVIVRETIANGAAEGLSASQIKTRLSQAIPRYRAEQIARNETVHAFRAGRLATDDYISNKYGLKIEKVWRTAHDHKVCPVCAAMDGKVVGLRDAFPNTVETDDGALGWEHTEWNNNGEVPCAHVNCRCSFDEVIVDE